jgi:VanZ family protein
MSVKNRFFWFASSWTLLIMVLLTIPGRSIPSVGIFEFDKLVHAGLFFVLTILWLEALSGGRVARAISVVALIIAFSFLTEWYQELMPIGRTADVFDAIADSVGALLGIAFWGIKMALTTSNTKSNSANRTA